MAELEWAEPEPGAVLGMAEDWLEACRSAADFPRWDGDSPVDYADFLLKEAEFAEAVAVVKPGPIDNTGELTAGKVVVTSVRASFRLVRTFAISSMIVVLAAGMHLTAGGVLPHPMIVTGLLAVTVVPVAALSSRWLSLPHLLILICLGQIWLHWSFTMPGSHDGHESMASLSRHGGHFVDVLAVDSSMAKQFLNMSSSMFSGHVLAALAIAILLSRGEIPARAIRAKPFHDRAYA